MYNKYVCIYNLYVCIYIYIYNVYIYIYIYILGRQPKLVGVTIRSTLAISCIPEARCQSAPGSLTAKLVDLR